MWEVGTGQWLIKLIFVTASYQTGLDTPSNDPKVDYSGIRGGEGWALAEAPALLVHAGHRPTWYNMYMDPNLGLGTCGGLKLILDSKFQGYTRVTKVSMM